MSNRSGDRDCVCDLPRYVNPTCPRHGAHEYHGVHLESAGIIDEHGITIVYPGVGAQVVTFTGGGARVQCANTWPSPDEPSTRTCDMDGEDTDPAGNDHYWHCERERVSTCLDCGMELCSMHAETHGEDTGHVVPGYYRGDE